MGKYGLRKLQEKSKQLVSEAQRLRKRQDLLNQQISELMAKIYRLRPHSSDKKQI